MAMAKGLARLVGGACARRHVQARDKTSIAVAAHGAL